MKTKMYTQNKGKKLAEQIKWEDEYREEVKGFDLLAYLESEAK